MTALAVVVAVADGDRRLVWGALFFGACTLIATLKPWLDARTAARRAEPSSSVTYDEREIRHQRADGTVESITWEDLDEILIVTTDAGPSADDVFWLLGNRRSGRGCAIANGAGGFKPFLERLQRLPGFDNEAVIAAMGSAANARFPVWERPPSSSPSA
jgi:hypothetical protein